VWSFRQLAALTKDSTYQGSFSALASTGEGDDVLAMHRDLCWRLTGSWWLHATLALRSLKAGRQGARPDQLGWSCE